jgi:Flp pilus assembly protein TadD
MNQALADSYHMEAKQYASQKAFEQALTKVDAALEINKKNPAYWLTKAMILDQLGRYVDVEPVWELITTLIPTNAAGWFYLGKTRAHLKKRKEAIDAYKKALEIKPNGLEAMVNLADLLMDHKTEYDHFILQAAIEEACTIMRRAIEIAPNRIEPLTEMGLALMRLGKLQDALPYFEKALDIAPTHSHTIVNNAFCHYQLGNFAEAERIYRIGMASGDWYAEFSLAQLLLLQGRMEEGLKHYDARLNPEEVPPRFDVFPRWRGEPLDGKTLLIWGEQGIGDELMFASLIPPILPQAKHIILEMDPRLVDMYRRSFPMVEVVSRTPPDPTLEARQDVDFQIPMGGLMALVQPKTDYPTRTGYLSAAEDKVAAYRMRYPERKGVLRVGVSWGSSRTETSRSRTITLKEWIPILRMENVEFYNFQYGETERELTHLKEETGIEIITDPDVNPLTDMEHMAALMTHMDLVISCANSTVHLAGALGVPVWVMTPKVPSWRWLLEREDSIWYSCVRLFRQSELWSWDDVVLRIADALKRYR